MILYAENPKESTKTDKQPTQVKTNKNKNKIKKNSGKIKNSEKFQDTKSTDENQQHFWQ